MKKGLILCLMAILCASSLNAQARTPPKKHKPYFRLVESYTQRTLPGRRGAPVQTGTHFIIIWEGPKSPETFFWRGDNGFLSCNMAKVHKVTKKGHDMPPGIDYIPAGDSAPIQKGDTVELSPVSGGKFPVPAEVPKDAKNTLYFKTGGSGWLAFPVKTMTRKPDISMP